MKTVTCKKCGTQIGFILSRQSGRRIPVDPLSVYVETQGQQNAGTLIDDQGVSMKNPPIGSIGYVPHCATCDDPNRFRNGRKGARL